MSCSNLMMHHTISSSGGSTLADLQQALEDYLPVLLGLVENGKTSFSPFVLDEFSLHNLSWLIALSLLCRKPFTIQSTICLGESGGWCRGNSYFFNSCVSAFIWMFIYIQHNADNFLFAPLSFFVCWCNCIFPGNSHVKCLVWGVVSFALDGYAIIITGQFITSSQNVHWW